MYPLHDKDLDRLSRNAAEHYEMDFGPSGWEQLEKRLDQELPQKKDRRRFLFWLFFIVVTTGSALIGLLINSQPVSPLASRSIKAAPVSREAVNNTPTGQTTVDNNSNTPGTPTTSGATEPATVDNADDAPQQILIAPSGGSTIEPAVPDQQKINAPSKSTFNNKITTTPFGLNNIPRGTYNAAKKPVRKQVPKNNKKPVNNDKNDQPFTTNNNLATTNTQPTTDAVQTPDKTTAGNKEITGTQPTNEAAAKEVDKTNDSTKTPAPIAITKDAAPKKKNNTQNRGLELGITGGPDASMVEFGPLYKAGYNVGLQVGYRFNDRWSVNTGIIYTRKFYQADSNTFHAPKRSYISYVKLDKLEGYCAMLDIPLNVRYDFSHNDKRRFFANTGVSSYLMDKQNYDYYYWQTWGPANYRDSSWSSGENLNYFFSVLNLSIGYERMLSKNFSIQAEPYLKIPLKGMGFGNMKMDSYGIYFSLKYKPQFGSKRSANKK